MTNGTRNQDIVSVVNTYDIVTTPQASNVYVDRGNVDIGMKYVKSWAGSDYPSTAPPDVFAKYFYHVDGVIDSAIPSVRVGTYVDRWVARHPKKRTVVARHSYSMTLHMRSDSTFAYNIVLGPQDHQESVRTFAQAYGTGHNIVPSSEWVNNDTLSLQGKLREKIAGSDFNMGIFLGEGREALELITGTAHRIRASLDAFSHGDVYRAAKALGSSEARARSVSRKPIRPKDFPAKASDKWLELQYGWLPLIKDVQGAAEFLAQTLNFPFEKKYQVRKKKPLAATVPNDIRDGGDYLFDGKTRGQLICFCKEVNVAQLLGLLDPASVLWEVTPWSFVADWFLPIGSYLAARGLDSSLTGTFVQTITRKENFVCSAVKVASGNTHYKTTKQPYYRSMDIAMDRVVSSSLFVPRPNFKSLDKVASWKHCANAVALLTGRFAGGRTEITSNGRAVIPRSK